MNSTKIYADFPPYMRKIKSTLSSWANADLHTCIDFCDYVFPDFPVEDLKLNLTNFLKSDLFESPSTGVTLPQFSSKELNEKSTING